MTDKGMAEYYTEVIGLGSHQQEHYKFNQCIKEVVKAQSINRERLGAER